MKNSISKIKNCTAIEQATLLNILKARFEKNRNRHHGIEWAQLEVALTNNPATIWSLNEMEKSGGEPDVVGFDKSSKEYSFFDCCVESPIGRRSLCYDSEALDARKEFKPQSSSLEKAAEMGIELLTEAQYRTLQQLGKFDCKTSSWIRTPDEIRKLGGALFGDFRYNTVFIYHNGASSYYAARGFRGCLKVGAK